MASWLQQRLKDAEGLLQAVDQTAKDVSAGAGPSIAGDGGASSILRTWGRIPQERHVEDPGGTDEPHGFPETPLEVAVPFSKPHSGRTSPHASASPAERVSRPASVEMTWEQVSEEPRSGPPSTVGAPFFDTGRSSPVTAEKTSPSSGRTESLEAERLLREQAEEEEEEGRGSVWAELQAERQANVVADSQMPGVQEEEEESPSGAEEIEQATEETTRTELPHPVNDEMLATSSASVAPEPAQDSRALLGNEEPTVSVQSTQQEEIEPGTSHLREEEEEAALPSEVQPFGASEQNETTERVSEDVRSSQDVSPPTMPLEIEPQELSPALMSSEPSARSQREARLVKMVESLKTRLDQARAENEQLEEMLSSADATASGRGGEVARLEDELVALGTAKASAEAALRREMEMLRSQLEQATSRVVNLEADRNALRSELTSARADAEAQRAERAASEGSLVASLRSEMERVEGALDEERAAHAAARRGAERREQNLEARLAELGQSLGAVQGQLEAQRVEAQAFQERCEELGVELESTASERDRLAREIETHLQQGGKEGDVTGDQDKLVEAQRSRIAALEASVAAAESRAETSNQETAQVQAQMSTLHAELAEAKAQLAASRAADVSDLQKRLRDTTELLYSKQTQVERLTADRAALQLALERERGNSASSSSLSNRSRSTLSALGGERGPGGVGSPEDPDDDVVPMASLQSYKRLVQNRRVGGAVRHGAAYIDAGAREVVRILRMYPAGRLVLLAYLLSVHLMIYLLLHRLQRRVLESRSSVAHVLDRDQIGT